LRAAWRLPGANVDVVAMEGDVELAEADLFAGALLDQVPQPVGDRNTAGVDPDEGDGGRGLRCAR